MYHSNYVFFAGCKENAAPTRPADGGLERPGSPLRTVDRLEVEQLGELSAVEADDRGLALIVSDDRCRGGLGAHPDHVLHCVEVVPDVLPDEIHAALR